MICEFLTSADAESLDAGTLVDARFAFSSIGCETHAGGIGLGFWFIMPNETDTALLLGLLGSLVAPSRYQLACGLGSFIAGLLVN